MKSGRLLEFASCSHFTTRRGGAVRPARPRAQSAPRLDGGQVLFAACLAGIALGTVGTSLHHALCHLLGGMFDAPHAETHAVILPYAISYLQPAVPGAIQRLAEAMETRPAPR